ncbi:MAG: pyridinium-3,5-bisthiocarboxylic acid mononucleotide nickel chelatase [Acidimicrobiaceae bacterium]|nr:pyridinium-3,5-bisthiocarboxylic acid mononucleotide nickel chelatase [Acidimicrobiaceae bacterium]MDQ1416726.1 pyridinium-3,5-bisthiocarboxylic acid mononucleotide nickel chelatase [Acidimicrobiaceae bacterium]
MTTVAWWHCFAGIAGDMALGSLVDAGADLEAVVEVLRALPVDGWHISAEPVLRCGVAATHVNVDADETGVIRTYAHIAGVLTEARLPERVRQRALATFAALAEVEGRLHRRPPSQVHFHELGGIDAIVDIVGTCTALELLGVDEIHASPVATGSGMIRSSHGALPNPAPAVVELLRGAPTYGRDLQVELTTPTGAALLAALAVGWGPMPPMRIQVSGFGAGSRDLDGLPNATQVVIGQATLAEGAAIESLVSTGQPAVLLEANLDDATGEVLAHTVLELLGAGAQDAWITPMIMKKGRPAHVVSALCDPALADQIVKVLMAETGSLGVRGQTLTRWLARRQIEEVEVDGFPVRVKVSPGRVKAEYDDVARVARRVGRPIRDITSRAEAQGRRRGERAEHPSAHQPENEGSEGSEGPDDQAG